MPSDLEIRLAEDGELQDVLLDGQSLWPIWFKVEWKGNGHLGAKIAGQRLSTREGDVIRFVRASGATVERKGGAGPRRARQPESGLESGAVSDRS